MYKAVFRILFFVSLIFCLGCEKDNDDVETGIVGTWQQISLNEDGNFVEEESVSLTFMQFDSNGIMRYHNGKDGKTTRSGWSYKDEMLNISIFMPTGFYVEDINSESLTLRRMDFVGDRLSTTISNWKKVDNKLFPETK